MSSLATNLTSCALVIVCIAALSAQTATGVLSGRIVDQTDAGIAGAAVSIRNPDNGVERSGISNQAGEFSFIELPPGRYEVGAKKPSFVQENVHNLDLHVGDHATITILMRVGETQEAVTVTADPLTLQTNPSVGTTITREFLEELPLNGRSFQSLIHLTPGVVPVPSSNNQRGQFSVNGQRDNANTFTVDGVAANLGMQPSGANFVGVGGDFGGFNALGATNSLIMVDSVEEFRIQTSSFAPEFGRSPGGQVSIISRSGTKSFHGSLSEYFRNEKMDSNDWFANLAGKGKTPLRNNDFGGTVGGPIAGKTFFFASYEGLQLRLPQVAVRTVPSIAARQGATGIAAAILDSFPIPDGQVLANGLARFNAGWSDPSSSNAGAVRIDQSIGSRWTLFGRYNNAPSRTASRTASGGGSVQATTELNFQTATGGATWVINPHMLNDLRLNYSRTSGATTRNQDGFGGGVPVADSAVFPSQYTRDTAQIGLYLTSSFSPSVLFGASGGNQLHQVNLVDSFSFTRGAHQFKFGADYRRLTPVFGFVKYQQNVYFSSIANVVSGNVSGGSVLGFSGPFYPRINNVSSFAQDTWRIRPSLTLTYGVRWDVEPPPGERDGRIPATVTNVNDITKVAPAPPGTKLWKTSYTGFAPRVGIAWQLRDEPRFGTVIRGGTGMFHDMASGQLGLVYDAFGYPYTALRTLTPTVYPLPTAIATPPPFGFSPPYQYLTGFDPSLKTPYSIHWNVSVEQGLGAAQSLSVSYVAAAGRNLYRREYLGSPTPDFTDLRIIRNQDRSDYESLQLQFQRRLSRGIQAISSYTWSHSIDTSSTDRADTLALFVSSPQADRGSSDFDIRHVFTTAISLVPGAPYSNPTLKHVLGGWSLDPIFRAYSAPPVNVTLFSDDVQGLLRPDLVAGVPVYLYSGAFPGGKSLNPAAFVARTDHNGLLGRNTLRGFGAAQLDLALQRSFALRERVHLRFRGELFNALNHPNFAAPDPTIGDGTFGQSTQMLNRGLGGLNSLYQLGGPRSVQLGLKLQF